MTAYDRNETEAALIDALRTATAFEIGSAASHAADAAFEARGMNAEPEPPASKPAEAKPAYTPRPYSKLRCGWCGTASSGNTARITSGQASLSAISVSSSTTAITDWS